jgi:hypothetical protein
MRKEETMKNENIKDRRTVKLENVLSKNYIPLFEGRPKRETVICGDDLLNLKIALNSSVSFEEFLSRV